MNAAKSPASDKPAYVSVGTYALLILLGALVVSIMILSCVPPVSKDALVHHLAVPKLYLKHGGIYEIPFMPFSYYPMNLDLLYLIPLYFGNDIVPKFMHFAFALLTAWLVFGYLKRRTPRVYALFGALLFLSIPIVVKLSITVYVDLGLIFFSTATLLLLLRWVETGFRYRFLAFSAIMCGLAMGTKYNGLITFLLLTAFFPFLYSRGSRGKNLYWLKSASQGLTFFFIAFLVFSPWMIRNYHWKGNPIYPLFDSHFSASSQPGVADKQLLAEGPNGHGGIFVVRRELHNEAWWKSASIPLRIFFQGKDGSPKYFDGKLSPFLLFLPFLAFYRIREDSSTLRTEKKVMLAYATLFFTFAFFSNDMRIRYISPIIPPMVLLSVFGLYKVAGKINAASSKVVQNLGMIFLLLISAASLAYNALYIGGQFTLVRPFAYLSGELSRDAYISEYRLEYPAIQYMNEQLPSESLTLFIFLGKRGYYCEKDYELDDGRLYTIIRSSVYPWQVFSALKEKGFTHLLVRYDIFDKWRRDPHLFSEEKQLLIERFLSQHTKLLFFKWGYGVSRLENESVPLKELSR